MVIRIMVMVPVYGVSSLISLFSLNAAFVIDAVRDIYEVSESTRIFLYTVLFSFRHLSYIASSICC